MAIRIQTTGSSTNNAALYIDDSDEMYVVNNTMHSSSPGYAVVYVNISNLTSDHNNFSSVGADVGYFNGTPYTDLTAWQAASGGRWKFNFVKSAFHDKQRSARHECVAE